jgi:hypothetical protein
MADLGMNTAGGPKKVKSLKSASPASAGSGMRYAFNDGPFYKSKLVPIRYAQVLVRAGKIQLIFYTYGKFEQRDDQSYRFVPDPSVATDEGSSVSTTYDVGSKTVTTV